MKPSVLVKKQRKLFGPKLIKWNGEKATITAEVCHDDECGNGHNTFSITGTIRSIRKNARDDGFLSGGCLHEEIAKHFPVLAPLIKWHLTSSDGPMHYIANTIYHAGERDHWGLLKGEFRQSKHGKTGLPMWKINIPYDYSFPFGEKTVVSATEKPSPLTFEYAPAGQTGEGKERDLDAARACAVWPEATDEELMAPDLRERLLARHATLMEEFQKAVESLGFIY